MPSEYKRGYELWIIIALYWKIHELFIVIVNIRLHPFKVIGMMLSDIRPTEESSKMEELNIHDFVATQASELKRRNLITQPRYLRRFVETVNLERISGK